jgi:hypothetical protein
LIICVIVSQKLTNLLSFELQNCLLYSLDEPADCRALEIVIVITKILSLLKTDSRTELEVKLHLCPRTELEVELHLCPRTELEVELHLCPRTELEVELYLCPRTELEVELHLSPGLS